MEARAKLFGHPVHQMLIVFPLGLLATSVIFDIVGLISGGETWPVVAYWTMLAGIIGALVALLISLPTASKLARLDPAGPHGDYFDELRARQKVTSSIAGVLAVAALVGGVMVR